MGRHTWIEESVRLDADVVAFSREQNAAFVLGVYHDSFGPRAYYLYTGQMAPDPSCMLTLQRVIRIDGCDKKSTAQHQVQLRTTPCNLGGQRWWFVCPGCSKSRKHLYWHLEDGWFACRECLRLKYASQCDNYRWDTRGFGIQPGIRYMIMRNSRADSMLERRMTFRNERKKRFDARHRANAETQK